MCVRTCRSRQVVSKVLWICRRCQVPQPRMMMMMVRVGMVGMLELAVVTVRNDVGRSAVGAAAVPVAVV